MTEDKNADESATNVDDDQLADGVTKVLVERLDPEDFIDGGITETVNKPYTTGQRIQFLVGAIAAALTMYSLGLWIIRSFSL